MVFTSVICQGEILALAEKNGWGTNKRGRLEQLLDQIPQLGISHKETIGAYAQINAWTHGNSVVAPNNAPPPRPAIPMKQNDMWIAATAHASGAKLVSTDNDFEHLDNNWIKFVYAPPH